MKIKQWTTSTTTGFSAEELTVINSAVAQLAQDRRVAELNDRDQDTALGAINDAINNAWAPGLDAPALVAAASRRLAGA